MKPSASLTGCAAAVFLLAPILALATATPPTPASSSAAPAPSPATAPSIIPSAPDVDASAYILVDYSSGQVLAARNPDTHLPPASLTKLMTCYAVFHALKAGALKLTDLVTISEHAWRAEGSVSLYTSRCV